MFENLKHFHLGIWAIVTIGLININDAQAVDEPSYGIVFKDGNFELREYEAFIIAETVVDANFSDAGNDGFRPLFKYISGKNDPKQKIKMTAPVLQEPTTDGDFSVSFVMPEGFTLQTTPQPADSKIRIKEIPARLVAVHKYSGRWTKKKYDLKTQELKGWIEQQKLEIGGEPIFARYDPPFKPAIFRRNEVHIPIKRAEVENSKN
jgi:effector-binding domain-containing protein